MSDLISRQAAIETICKACSIEGDYHECDGYPETSTCCEGKVALKALPSAQPEIIRCHECMHWEYDVIFADGWCRGKHQGDPEWFCGDAERREG